MIFPGAVRAVVLRWTGGMNIPLRINQRCVGSPVAVSCAVGVLGNRDAAMYKPNPNMGLTQSQK